MKMNPIKLLFILLIVFPAQALALELYSLVSEKCQINTGFIIDSDSENIHLIDLSGKNLKIAKEDTKFVNTYSVLESPIGRILNQDSTKKRLVDIYVDSQEEALFSGWAVRFVEDLVEFVDTTGDTHVLELYNISKIRPSKLRPKKLFRPRSKKVEFNLGNIAGTCPKKTKRSKNSIIPMRTLADKIQLSEFFSNFDRGFDRLTSYEERTYLYALPYLYEKETVMGFSFFGTPIDHTKEALGLPMYYQWARGSEYRFQSFNQIGGVPVEFSPTIEPLFVARTDLKSHIFHGSFLGNLNSLAAGTEFYSANFETEEDFLNKQSSKSRFSPSFNYMALMGLDYERWSFSIGTYFPIYLIQINDRDSSTAEFREVLGSSLSPIFRLRYTHPKYNWRALVSLTNLDVDNVTDLDLSVSNTNSVVSSISRFKLSNIFLRVGGDYHFRKNIKLSLDQLAHIGKYEETTTGSAENYMDYKAFTTSAKIRHSFGDYVRLSLYINLYIQERDFSFSGLSDKENDAENTIGGNFEFVF